MYKPIFSTQARFNWSKSFAFAQEVLMWTLPKYHMRHEPCCTLKESLANKGAMLQYPRRSRCSL